VDKRNGFEMNIFKPRNLKKMIWIFILFVFAETANAASIISTAIPTLVPQKADQIQRSSIHEGQDVSIGPMRKIFDMDLIGDGKTEKFKLESKTGNISDSEINSELKVQRIMSSGELETIGRFSYPDVGYVQVDIAPLNSQTPKKSFLIVNCRMGSVLWDLHVYQWDGKKFLEVESEPYLWGHPKTMRDGINAILVFSPGFIPKGPDIYIFQKGCLVPSNYHYPEIYESDIKEIYKVFSDKSYQPSQRIQICIRDLMENKGSGHHYPLYETSSADKISICPGPKESIMKAPFITSPPGVTSERRLCWMTRTGECF